MVPTREMKTAFYGQGWEGSKIVKAFSLVDNFQKRKTPPSENVRDTINCIILVKSLSHLSKDNPYDNNAVFKARVFSLTLCT